MATVTAGSTGPSRDASPSHHRRAKSREFRKARKALGFLSNAQRMMAHFPYSPTRTHTEIIVLRKDHHRHHHQSCSCVGDITTAPTSPTTSTTPSSTSVGEFGLPLSPTTSEATPSLSEDERMFAPKNDGTALVAVVIVGTPNLDVHNHLDDDHDNNHTGHGKRGSFVSAVPLPLPQQHLEATSPPVAAVTATTTPAAVEAFRYRVVPYEHLLERRNNPDFVAAAAPDEGRPLVGPRCVKALSHCVRLKIGGVCSDLSPLVVASLIHSATGGTVIAGIDMFRALHGCCSVWVATPADAARIRSVVHHQLWSGSEGLNGAVLCQTQSAAGHLEGLLQSAHARFGTLPFPTHLMTVEPWQPVGAVRTQRAKRAPPSPHQPHDDDTSCAVTPEI